MIIQGQVGPVATATSLPVGQQAIIRQGNLGDVIVSTLHADYYEATYRRSMFGAANPTGQTLTAFTSGTTTVAVGILLSNPVNTTVNLVINKVGFSVVVAPASAMPMFLGVGYNSGTNVTHTTPITPRNLYTGVGATGVGLVDASFTMPTAPNFTHVLGNVAATTVASQTPVMVDLDGSVILPPGAYAGIFSTVAAGASGFFGSISWEEVPL